MKFGENWVFVENPKTGSTSLNYALPGETVMSKHDNLVNQSHPYPWRRWRFWTVRNPWDRMVSGYHHNTASPIKEGRTYPDFDEWVRGAQWITGPGVDFKRTPQMFWGHRCNVTLRFENLAEDVADLAVRLGIDINLPHVNASRQRGEYRDYYTPALRGIIADRFAQEIMTYGYKF